jgi:hypothetical protein
MVGVVKEDMKNSMDTTFELMGTEVLIQKYGFCGSTVS